jgi:hypothetical protein
MNQEILSSVQGMREGGLKDERIRQVLLATGCSPEDIEEALKTTGSVSPVGLVSREKSMISPVKKGLSIMVLLVVLAYV